MSAFFEVSQYTLSIGQTDITDLLTNTLGGIIGLNLYWMLKKNLSDKMLHRLIIVIGSLIFIVVAYYLKIRLDFMQRMRQMIR